MLVCIRHIYHGRFHPIWKARRATKTAQTISVDAFRRVVALVSLWRPAKGRLRGLAADSQIEAEKLSRTFFKFLTLFFVALRWCPTSGWCRCAGSCSDLQRGTRGCGHQRTDWVSTLPAL